MSSSDSDRRLHRPRTVLRDGETVTFLELFFDLVLVLALTQATAIMAADPTWQGLAKGVLVLGVMWWAWVGYAWLTSVVDPEEGINRLVIAGAMAALLIAAIALPEAFDDRALLFAGAYAVVRYCQLGLFWLAASTDDAAALRRSVTGLFVSTTIAVAIIIGAAFADGPIQGALWLLAIGLDLAGPYVFGSEGWRLSPKHFAERHGLIIIIALGESIVAIGIGAEARLGFREVVAVIVGVGVAFAMWWLYFDVVEKVASHRLQKATPGAEQNRIARDSYSYLHLPMVTGIVLVALGMKKTIGAADDHLKLVVAVAMFGGMAIYLLAHVAFRWRNVHRLSTQRLVAAVISVAAIPVALVIPALASLTLLAVIAATLVVYETARFRDARNSMRAQLAH
ncbi:low temperature requirement protein A [Williamsia sp. CHRR-6]|uniref:low temperature requirement protein A n=1 Tax=Williamsia sp. CHRR-6 TaxID=2835871 RepID=UPI001BD98234|nr:low temperature requirement protein A [Williamsia sp. CHRR-6]MBT0565861.1 low temperature requirement protein A [Williamsia sp. CHRR-6]